MNKCAQILSSLFPVVESDAARINDPYYTYLVQMYRGRAKFLRNLGLSCLVFVGVFIAVGIGVFLTGDPQDTQRAESEIRLGVELSQLRRSHQAIGAEEARLIADAGFIERANTLAMALGQVPVAVESVVQAPSSEIAEKPLQLLDVASAILEAVREHSEAKDNSPSEFVIDVSPLNPNDSKRFPRRAIELVAEQMRDHGLNLSSTIAAVSDVREKFESLESGQKHEPDTFTSSAFKRAIGAIGKLKPVGASIRASQKDVELALVRWQQNAQVRQEQRQTIETSIVNVENQLKEVRAEREKILFMAWVPDLTVRVGAVVLLLFLTQILIAAYRYTMSLSAFYLSRSDAIQLLQPGAASAGWYDIEHLRTLAECMSPSTIYIDEVKAPTDQVAEIAKAWIGKK